MDIIKYRKWYLLENWRDNAFRTVLVETPGRIVAQKHLSSGTGFWLNDNVLCIGYEMCSNTDIFRPIFSHKRQRLLEHVHAGILGQQFWQNVKSRYYVCLSKIKTMPLECVVHVVNFIYK